MLKNLKIKGTVLFVNNEEIFIDKQGKSQKKVKVGIESHHGVCFVDVLNKRIENAKLLKKGDIVEIECQFSGYTNEDRCYNNIFCNNIKRL